MSQAGLSAVLDRFPKVWCVDFEFMARAGERPEPVCCVALELRSGQEIRLWGEGMASPPPFGPDDLYVAYYASAEMGCHLALGWPLPAHVLDLFTEFRTFSNGRDDQLGLKGASLLAALAFFGLSHLDPDVKSHWRERVIAGPPYDDQDRVGILDYCASDVYSLQGLLPRLVNQLGVRPFWLDHALLRGRYMRAVARMECTGVPVDKQLFDRLSTHWDQIKSTLIDGIRQEYPFYEGTTFKQAKFAAWLGEKGIAWPRTESGHLLLTEDTFKKQALTYPILGPVREVQNNLAKLRITDMAIGADGRNRTLLSPFRARTGRNQPAASRFIFAPSVWLRRLIKPEPGRALAYIDFTSQEIGIAAALSGDQAMMQAYQSGDPYMGFAIRAGLAPAGATKHTHKKIRDYCKFVVLGILFGMQSKSIAAGLGISVLEAERLLRAHRKTYTVFWGWVERVGTHAMLLSYLDTCFGWRLHITEFTKPTALLNHPMQSQGAEMLRLACCFLTEIGLNVCAPVHDAVLIEAAEEEIEERVRQAQVQMARASRIVLEGFEIRTDVDIIRHPDRYDDPRVGDMWDRVMGLLEQIETAPESCGQKTTNPSQVGDK
ncbi:MAG: DNA polymerase I [Betaproteobacteria bacterium]|nr:DNA polymerase I [Betaproteobacteria bacterium]